MMDVHAEGLNKLLLHTPVEITTAGDMANGERVYYCIQCGQEWKVPLQREQGKSIMRDDTSERHA